MVVLRNPAIMRHGTTRRKWASVLYSHTNTPTKCADDTSDARYLIAVNENLAEPRTVTVKPVNAAHKVCTIANSKPEGRTSLTLQLGDGAVIFVSNA
jgi:hypothetical protein